MLVGWQAGRGGASRQGGTLAGRQAGRRAGWRLAGRQGGRQAGMETDWLAGWLEEIWRSSQV